MDKERMEVASSLRVTGSYSKCAVPVLEDKKKCSSPGHMAACQHE